MFIFTLPLSLSLSVLRVCLRSTDLVMNNLFHAGNTFCETQQPSVETLQSADWGVLNYISTTLWSCQRNAALTPSAFKRCHFHLRVSTLTRRHKSSLFVSERSSPETCWISSANVLHRNSMTQLVTTVCCVCCNCTKQSTTYNRICAAILVTHTFATFDNLWWFSKRVAHCEIFKTVKMRLGIKCAFLMWLHFSKSLIDTHSTSCVFWNPKFIKFQTHFWVSL